MRKRGGDRRTRDRSDRRRRQAPREHVHSNSRVEKISVVAGRIPEISDLRSSRRTAVRHVREPLVSSRPGLSNGKTERDSECAEWRDGEKVKREDDPEAGGWGSPAG